MPTVLRRLATARDALNLARGPTALPPRPLASYRVSVRLGSDLGHQALGLGVGTMLGLGVGLAQRTALR